MIRATNGRWTILDAGARGEPSRGKRRRSPLQVGLKDKEDNLRADDKRCNQDVNHRFEQHHPVVVAVDAVASPRDGELLATRGLQRVRPATTSVSLLRGTREEFRSWAK